MVFAGGLEVIPSRVLLDVAAWIGLSYSIWTATHWKNSVAFLGTVCMVIMTSGPTSRWPVSFPMAPIVAIQTIRRFGKLQNSKLLKFLSFFLVAISVGLAVLFPPLQLPRAQAGGPYSVGAVDFFLPIDPAKAQGQDVCSLFNHTQVRARLLYPTHSTEQNKMPYLHPSLAIEFLQESMKAAAPPELKAYDWLLHHWLLAELPAQRHAGLMPSSEKETFPLVVYSHGLMGNYDLYSYQAMSLATQGVLVLMLNHLDGSAPIAEHKDGSRITFDYDIVQLWKDGKEEEYVRERRSRTEWRTMEFLGATDAILALNAKDESSPFWNEAPELSLKGRIQTDNIFFMGHSFGGATAFTAAHRRPELFNKGGGVIAHEPAVDWIPDDARRSLFPLDRLKGLESSHNFTGGTGGLEYHASNNSTEGSSSTEHSIHDLNLLILFSQQWRLLTWGESHIFEEMHQKGLLGQKGGVSHFAVVEEAVHNEFSDMCMLTPLWLARGTGATGPRNPLETAREIEEHTWKFVSSVLHKDL